MVARLQELRGYASAGVAAANGTAALLATVHTSLATPPPALLTDTHAVSAATASLLLLAAELGAADQSAAHVARVAMSVHAAADDAQSMDVVQLLHRALTTCVTVLQHMEAGEQGVLLDAESLPTALHMLGSRLLCAAAAALDAYVHVVRGL